MANRHLPRALLAVSLLAVSMGNVSSPVAASTSGGGGPCNDASPCHISGLTVDGNWSTVPDSGPVSGTLYRQMYLTAGTSSEASHGTTSSSFTLFYDAVTVTFDGSGIGTPVQETTGFGPLLDGSFTISQDLRTASLSGHMVVTTCQLNPDWSTIACDQGAPVSINATWVGNGGKQTYSSTFHARSFGLVSSQVSVGAGRRALASLSANGLDAGSTNWADIADMKSMMVSVCRGC